MRRGDLIFFYPATLIDRVVVRYTGLYCHCGLFLGGDLFISAQWWKGIDFSILSEYHKPYDVYRIKDISFSHIDKMCEYAISLRGKKYDKKQALSVPFFKMFSNSDYYFCSEYLATLCIYIGRIPDKHPERISPTDLANQEFLIILDKIKKV